MHDWNDLRFFLAVAAHGNLAAAARELGVNHSTVFRRINALERRMGASVFDRRTAGYVLTEAGEAMLEHARRADDAIQAAARAVAGRDYRLAGDIRITTAPNLAVDYVSGYLARFRALHPGIRVEVAVSDSDYDLARREADLALRATSRPPDYLVGRRIVTLPWYVMGGVEYVGRHGRPAGMSDLAGHRLIGGDDGFMRVPVFAWLREAFPREQFVATANDLNTMAAMAIAGLGLACLPADQVKPGLEHLFPVEPAHASELWLLRHPDLRAVARIRTFADFLTEALRADERLAGVRSPA